MAYQKRPLREVATGGRYEMVQELTSTSTGTEIEPFGLTTITSASTDSTNTFGMKAAKNAGVHKHIAVTLGTTDSVVVTGNSTLVTFFGSTNATCTFSTGTGEKYLQLIATSTIEWAVVSQSTGVTFSA
jgi:hypothetical protein